jgi:hypothetical protein
MTRHATVRAQCAAHLGESGFQEPIDRVAVVGSLVAIQTDLIEHGLMIEIGWRLPLAQDKAHVGLDLLTERTRCAAMTGRATQIGMPHIHGSFGVQRLIRRPQQHGQSQGAASHA